MKRIVLLMLLSAQIFAQNQFVPEVAGASELRAVINKSDAYFLTIDYANVAEFKSGIGEFVNFYPAEFKNLNTNAVTKGLKIQMKISIPVLLADGKTGSNMIYRSAILDASDVKLFIEFLEKNVAPKVGKADKKDVKRYEATIKFKEIIFTYAYEKSSERITIFARDYGVTGRNAGVDFIEFWTETQVDKVPDLLMVLKKII
jgi:hypothetical protein